MSLDEYDSIMIGLAPWIKKWADIWLEYKGSGMENNKKIIVKSIFSMLLSYKDKFPIKLQ